MDRRSRLLLLLSWSSWASASHLFSLLRRHSRSSDTPTIASLIWESRTVDILYPLGIWAVRGNYILKKDDSTIGRSSNKLLRAYNPCIYRLCFHGLSLLRWFQVFYTSSLRSSLAQSTSRSPGWAIPLITSLERSQNLMRATISLLHNKAKGWVMVQCFEAMQSTSSHHRRGFVFVLMLCCNLWSLHDCVGVRRIVQNEHTY